MQSPLFLQGSNNTGIIQQKQRYQKKYLFAEGVGRTGNLMFIFASVLALAMKLGREPVLSPQFQQLYELFPAISELNIILTSTEWKKRRQSIQKVVREKGSSIYNPLFRKYYIERNVQFKIYLQCYRYFEHKKSYIKKLFKLGRKIKDQAQYMLRNYARRACLLQDKGKLIF